MHKLCKSVKRQSASHCIANGHNHEGTEANYHPPDATIHHPTPSHLKGLVQEVARQHVGLPKHQLTAASRRGLDTDAATLLPSAGPGVAAA